MCGIVGYIGEKQASPILLKGLKRLEYRGYDSAGIAVLNSELKVFKKAGKVADLEKILSNVDVSGTLGIGHTRWATHGLPNDTNAHPHTSMSGRLVLIHNGIIENYNSLKEELRKRGYTFYSETDTEVLVNLIEDALIQNNTTIENAVRIALNKVVGAYAIALLDNQQPNLLVAARKSSPLVIGLGENEFFVASDASSIIEYTRNVIYLDDNEYVVLDRKGTYEIKDLSNVPVNHYIQKLDMDLEKIEKGGFPHFMLKEIYEQPRALIDALRGRFNASQNWINLGAFREYESKMTQAKRYLITACGTSWHAGLVGEYLIEDLARIPVEVEYASEFRYRNPVIQSGDVLLAISQSGETADTLAAMELAKKNHAFIYGVCNVIGSSIARMANAGSYTHAGPEIGVASTKAFTTQVAVLSLIALETALKKGTLSNNKLHQILCELEQIPQKMEKALQTNEVVKQIAKLYKDVSNFLYLGRGYNFPVALEGALKLKEISYIHAEGYPAAEMKHGPIALIDEYMPVVVLATNQSAYEKIVSNIQEVKARKGKVIAVVNEGDTTIANIADHVIEIPETEEILTPLLTVIPLQLLSYHMAVMRGCNVDQPRNLAKSVTVE